jgi:RHS repeat-associated protein
MKNLTHPIVKLFVVVFTSIAPFFAMAQNQHKIVTKYENQRELTATGSITFKDGFTILPGTEFRAYISPNAGIPVNVIMNTLWDAIVSYDVRVPGIIDPTDTLNGINQVSAQVQTFDHFGRVIETQKIKATPDLRDLIQFNRYDSLGREPEKAKFYAHPSGLKNYHSEGYRADFYDFHYTGNVPKKPSIEFDLHASEVTKWDNSPLNRVIETGTGREMTWSSLTDRPTMRYAFLAGADYIIKYRVAIDPVTGSRSLSSGGNIYDPLNINTFRIKDENVRDTSLNGVIHEIKTEEGQLIVKRQFNRVGGTIETLSTYYVYDELGNLSFVLPPKANPDDYESINQDVLNNLCYQYKYDSQQRMIGKKVPGKGWEYMIYNKADQVVMTQDSVQRTKTNQEWNFIKYDGLGRSVVSGIFTHTGSTVGANYQSAMQAAADTTSKQREVRTTTGIGYTSNTFPKTGLTVLTINYYDDYNFPGGNPYPYTSSDASGMTRGLLTGSKVAVLGAPSNMLWTVNYYDRDGRAVKAYKQHYKGGGTAVTGNYDEISNTYDFTGAVLTSNRSHKVAGTEQLKVLNEYSYDHGGRKIDTWQTINTGPRILLSRLEPDELNQLYKKNLHSANGGASFLQTITYGYNYRHWLRTANAPLLNMRIAYDGPDRGAVGQYNGNISEIEYTGLNSGNRWFKFTYDGLNRLKKSEYSYANELSEEIAYDKAGNITALKRGLPTNPATYYSYTNGGLSNVLSSTSGPVSGSFSYDGNGNAISDGRRNISSIAYNQLNLPSTVTTTIASVSTQVAAYTYDASGTKLKSVQGAITREYISGIQYTNGVIDFVATEEGRAVRKPSDGTYRYEYNLKDHLGNVRVSFDDNNGTARVIQEDEFYAFGLNRSLFNSGTKNNYLYNGKELQTALSEEYDYGARFYDPVIARWQTIDPLAELARRWSPYNYAMNNPMRYIDPDGMAPESWNQYLKNSDAQSGVNWGTQMEDDKKKQEKRKKAENGSYTNYHVKGKYSGKGGEGRAKVSARRIAREYDDPLVSTEHTSTDNNRQAYKDEDDRINRDEGGHKSPDNYNKRRSPGAKYNEEDRKAEEKRNNNSNQRSYVSEEPDAQKIIIQKRFEFPKIGPPPPGTAARITVMGAVVTVLAVAFALAGG